MNVTSLDTLRELYAAPGERAVRKQLSSLDPHCRRFIELSPFLVLATAGAKGGMDASPRGGVPGETPLQVAPLVQNRDEIDLVVRPIQRGGSG